MAFASPRFACLLDWNVLEESCGSDDNLILVEFSIYVKYHNIQSSKWIFKKADRKKFPDISLGCVDFNSDLETSSEIISEAVQFAARESNHRSKGTGKIRNKIDFGTMSVKSQYK